MPYKKKKRALDENGNPLPHAPPRTTWAVEVSITLLVIGTPLAIGTVHLWPVVAMLSVATFAFAALIARGRRRHLPIKLFPMGLLLLIACVWTGLQLVPLPPGLVGALSPGAGEVFEQVYTGTPLSDAWRPLSLSAPATALELLKLLAAALAFLVVVNYFTDRHRARRLLKAVAWSGFLVALVGFFTKLFMATQILGFYPLPRADVFFFSTFVNPNHLAGFLLLCAPVALGLSLSAHGRQDRALYGFMGVIMGVAVFMSLSRGGMVALVAGLVFLMGFAATRRARRLRHTVAVQAAVAAVLVLAGYLAYDAVIKELKTLGDAQAVREDTKIQSWSAVMPMLADHPITGIGRGAYRTVYPRYKTLNHRATFTHAENETLQYLADWGFLVGGAFVLGLIGCFLVGLRRAKTSYSMGGILAGVFACMLHNQVDFNLETGAVMLVFFVLFGVLAAAPFSHAGKPGEFETRVKLPRPAAWGLVAAVVAIAAAATPYAARHDFDADSQHLLEVQNRVGKVEPCDDSAVGRAACELMDHHPADYLAPLVIGRANLAAEPPDLPRAVRWLAAAMFLNPTDPVAHRLAGRALFLIGHKDQALVEYRLAIRHDPRLQTAAVTEVLRLGNDPDSAIRATPAEAEPLLATARILNTLGRKEAAERAARMSLDHDAARLDTLDLLARLTFDAKRYVETVDLTRRAIEIDPQHDFAWVMQAKVLLAKGEKKQAEEVLREGWAQIPDSTQIAHKLVELYLTEKRYRDAEATATRLKTFADSDDRSQGRLTYLLGRIKEARQQFFDARQLYRQASDMQPDNLPYLYRLGRMEEKVGAWEAAERIFQKLAKRRFRAQEMDERILLVRKAAEIERDKALWDRYVQPKKDDE